MTASGRFLSFVNGSFGLIYTGQARPLPKLAAWPMPAESFSIYTSRIKVSWPNKSYTRLGACRKLPVQRACEIDQLLPHKWQPAQSRKA